MTERTENQYDSSGWSQSLYQKAAPFVYSTAFTAPVLELLAPKPGERIIDFGCGSGEVTLELEKAVTRGHGGFVVGIDSSESMLAKARERGVKHAYLDDIQNIGEFPGSEVKFDAVFSNATLHWCKRDPIGVLESVKRVLKPGGRFAAEMGGYMNCIGVRSALHHVLRNRGRDPDAIDPWYFPSVADYTKLLEAAGFKSVKMELIPRPTPLPEGLAGWIYVFARSSLLRNFTDEEVADIIREVEDMCRVDLQDSSGSWTMIYMRLRFLAVLEKTDRD